MARDRAVIDRAYPALDEARALATNDRAEYEAYVTLQTIGSADSLREIVRQSAELGRMRGVPPEGAAMTLSVADARAVLAEHFPTARAQLAAQVESDRIERSEEHTSELQSLMRISYAVFCLKKKTTLHHTIQKN